MKIFKQLTKNMNKIPLTPFSKGGIIAVILTLTFFISAKTSAEIYISDDFTVTSSGFPANGDVNLQISNGRQTGTFAPLTYSWWNGLSGNANPRLTSAGPLEGLCTFDRAVSMNHDKNFNDIVGGFFIEFDLINLTNIEYGTSVSFGKAYAMAGWQHPFGLDIVFNRTAGVSGYFISDNAIGDDLSNTGPTKGYFQFPELSYETNPTIRVKLCVMNEVFPATNYPMISLFLNGKPYPIYTNGLGAVFSHTITTKPTNNYIVINQNPPYDDGGVLDPIIAIDNLTIATLSDNNIGTANWSTDANSGINGSKIYTHAVNFGEVGNTTINGLNFEGSGSNSYGSNWKLVSTSANPLVGPISSYAEGKNPSVSGASLALVSNFLKSASSGDAGGLVLSKLTPGLNYKISVFGFGFEAVGGRSSYISTSDGIKFPIIDQDEFGENGAQLLTYEYTAPANGTFSISTTPFTPSTPAWNWFAFCNEVLPPDAPTSISASQGVYTDKIKITWSIVDSTEYYTLYRADSSDISSTNFATQIVLNSYDDVVPNVTIAQDYYYWVQACNTGGNSSFVGPVLGFTKSENPPDSPTSISPDSLNIITSPVEFIASVYNDGGGFDFKASQWQVSEDADFSPVKWDSSETAPPTNFIFAPQNQVYSGTNFWRVRYMNDRNTWSDWSESNLFICVSKEQQSGIFKDNFNVLPTGDVNTDYAISGRQTGTASPLAYTVSGTTKVGGFTDYSGKLMLGQNSGCSPNASFESSLNFKIEFDAVPHLFDGSGDWISCGFGKTDNSSLSPISPSGLAAVFFTHTGFQLFDGEKLLGTSWEVPTNGPFHVTITGSSVSFSEYDPAYCSVFVNDRPMVIGEGDPRSFLHILSDGFMKNYVTLFSNNGAENNPSTIDNFTIKETSAKLTVHPWNDNASSQIDSSKNYSHLVNLNGDDVIINDKTFIGTGVLTNCPPDDFCAFVNGAPEITKTNWAILTSHNWLGFYHIAAPNSLITGTSEDLAKHFVLNGRGSMAIQLFNLTPNSSNSMFVYCQAFENGSRIASFSSSAGNITENVNMDEYGEGNGIIVQFDYIASKQGSFTLSINGTEVDAWHISGFANLETGTTPPKLDVDSMLCFDEVAPGGNKTLSLGIANIGGGIVDGTISGLENPFSVSDNSYLAVPGTNSNVSVTFSPTEERNYINVITLTGNGGTTEVTLTGSGIPEPCLFIIYNLLFIIYYLKRK